MSPIANKWKKIKKIWRIVIDIFTVLLSFQLIFCKNIFKYFDNMELFLSMFETNRYTIVTLF